MAYGKNEGDLDVIEKELPNIYVSWTVCFRQLRNFGINFERC